MPKRMVSAFKKGIEEDKEPPKGVLEERVRKTLTMNPRRQEILQYLCRYPCSRLSKIAKANIPCRYWINSSSYSR